MPRIGEQGDLLRALGRILDEEGASEVEIEDQDSFIAVSWKTEGFDEGKRTYREAQLATLRATAQFLRGGAVAGSTSVESLTELLRTLGQELDDAGMEMAWIGQMSEGFRVSAVRNGVYQAQFVSLSELRQASDRHRLKRGKGGGRKPEEIDPFLGVAIGLRVITQDNQQIGKVGGVQGRSFRVKTPLLQRDFWLLGSHVVTADPSTGVRLSLAKGQIDANKRDGPADDDAGVPFSSAWKD